MVFKVTPKDLEGIGQVVIKKEDIDAWKKTLELEYRIELDEYLNNVSKLISNN